MTALAALIAKLEAATEGSRELDARVHVAIIDPEVITDPGGYRGERPVVKKRASAIFDDKWDWTDIAELISASRYTTSLDVALTLVEPGSEYSISTLYGLATVKIGLNYADGPIGERRNDGNVCLALCIAALRARMGK